MPSEFSRPTEIRPFLDKGEEMEIAANAEERAGLARRFGIPAVESFSVRLRGEKAGAGMHLLKGRVKARLTRTCVRTLEAMPETVDEAFEVRLIDRALFETMGEAHDEEPVDVEVLEGDTLDLGELAAQYLSVLMDPYPRSAAAEALAPLGENAPEGAGPFAALKKLRKKP